VQGPEFKFQYNLQEKGESGQRKRTLTSWMLLGPGLSSRGKNVEDFCPRVVAVAAVGSHGGEFGW
jgi:hypothetical protein